MPTMYSVPTRLTQSLLVLLNGALVVAVLYVWYPQLAPYVPATPDVPSVFAFAELYPAGRPQLPPSTPSRFLPTDVVLAPSFSLRAHGTEQFRWEREWSSTRTLAQQHRELADTAASAVPDISDRFMVGVSPLAEFLAPFTSSVTATVLRALLEDSALVARYYQAQLNFSTPAGESDVTIATQTWNLPHLPVVEATIVAAVLSQAHPPSTDKLFAEVERLVLAELAAGQATWLTADASYAFAREYVRQVLPYAQSEFDALASDVGVRQALAALPTAESPSRTTLSPNFIIGFSYE